MLKNYQLVVLYYLVWIMSGDMILAQSTFSKTYHLEVGPDNRVHFFFLQDTNFIVATTHDGDMEVLSALSRFNYDGDILQTNSISDFVFGKSRSVVLKDSGFEVAGHRWSRDDNQARGLQLLNFNNELDIVEQKLIEYEINRVTNFPGILDLDSQSKMIFGSFINTSSIVDSGAYIGLLDRDSDSIRNEVIYKGPEEYPYVNFKLCDLQQTRDSNLLFIAETSQRDESLTGTGSYFEIVKFNREGEIINKIREKLESNKKALFEGADGGLYFFNKRIPFRLDTILPFVDQSGGLVKINEEMDSVLWSFQIEDEDEIDEERGHSIFGITGLRDGHFLACGNVGLKIDNISESIGFLCKFTKDGEILWVREYGIPIPEEYVALEMTGVLGSGRIEDCKELEDGRILCMGEHAYAKPETSFYRELWMLMLDADGCLTPNCDPTLVLTNTHTVETFQEGNIYPNPVSDILHISEVDFDAYKIYDLMGRLVQEGVYSPTIDLSGLPASGMYVLQLKEEGRLKSVFNLVKN